MTPEHCNGFQVLENKYFYPIHYSEWKKFFKTEDADEKMRNIEKARGIKIWNNLSSNEIVKSKGRVPYSIITENYCPHTYKICDAHF